MSKLVEIYTDGACSQGAFMPWPGGWAAMIVFEGRKYAAVFDGKLHTTNNEMELTAFLEGLKFFEKELAGKGDYQVVIYTDSAYIHNCFEQKWYEKWIKNDWKTAAKEPVKNQELWIQIFNMVSKIPGLEIKKVKAHADNFFNNYVDKLAVEAKEQVVTDNEDYISA